MESKLTREKTKITTNKNGITLIALVVTIIVLLILAGISIMMLTGQNGILVRAQEAGAKTSHAELYETLNLESAEYMTESRIGEYGGSLIDYLLEKEYIEKTEEEGKYLIKVENILGQKGKYGNGTDGKTDVYKLEEIEKTEDASKNKTYKVIYYEKTGDEGVQLGVLSDGETTTATTTGVTTISSKDFILMDKLQIPEEELVDPIYDRMKEKNIMLLSPENLEKLGISTKDFVVSALGFDTYDSLKEAANSEQDETKKNAYSEIVEIIETPPADMPENLYNCVLCMEALAYSSVYPEESKLKLTAPDGEAYIYIELKENTEGNPQTDKVTIYSVDRAGDYEFNMQMKEKKYKATFKVNQYEILVGNGFCVYDFNNKKYLKISSGKVTIDGKEINLVPVEEGNETHYICKKEDLQEETATTIDSVRIKFECEGNITIEKDLGALSFLIGLIVQ